MNFLPSQDQISEEYNSALIVEYVQGLETKNEVTEKDLEQFNALVFQTDLSRDRLQSIMHLLGTILINRPEEWLQEEGEKLLTASHANRQWTEHSLPETDTATMIVESVRRDFENSLVLEVQLPPDEEAPIIESPQSDLMQSGIFSDENEVPEDEAPITLPTYKDPRLDSIRRLKTTGKLLAPDTRVRVKSTYTFSQVTHVEGRNFEMLTRKEMLEEVENLIGTIDLFFREIHETAPSTEREKLYFDQILEMNDRTIRKILIIERKILNLQQELHEIAEIRSTRLEQFAHLEDLEAELKDVEKTSTNLSYLQLTQLRFISFIKDVFHEQQAFPKKVNDLQKKITELSAELSSLQITFPESW